MRGLLGGMILLAACRRPLRDAPAPAPLVEEHCWWTVWRTALPPDSVAERHRRAFAHVGLAGAAWAHQADTVWASAGPTPLVPPGAATAAPYASRIVAYRAGDTTYYRHFVATPAAPGAPAAREAPSSGARRIALCQAIAREAAVRGRAPREPTGEEAHPVWRRRP